MSKILNKYENGLDKAWYDSSNILYSECDDRENELKVVRITFKDGRTYEYKDVNVHEYLRFREATSQGSVFAQSIKKNPVIRLEDRSVEQIQIELKELLEPTNDKKIIFKNEDIVMIYGNSESIITQYNDLSLKEVIIRISNFFNITLKDDINKNSER